MSILKKHKKRTYNAENRQERSRELRNRIIVSAKKLFESKGFDKVTIEEIAQAAVVSTPSIYAIFQSKRGILLALMDAAFSSEQHATLVNQVLHTKSARKRLEIAARISRELYDAEKTQLNILRGSLILDPEFKELEMEREKRRYERQKETVMITAKEKAFIANLSLSKIRDVLWAFTSRDFYRMLVIEQGWSSDEYETWLAQLLIRTLLK